MGWLRSQIYSNNLRRKGWQSTHFARNRRLNNRDQLSLEFTLMTTSLEDLCDIYQIGVAVHGPGPAWVVQSDSVRAILHDSSLFRAEEVDRWNQALMFPTKYSPIEHTLELARGKMLAYRAKAVGGKVVPVAWKEDGSPESWVWARAGKVLSGDEGQGSGGS